MSDAERQAAYACDVTYGTNNEFGFDYLRDNMKFELDALRPARAALRDRGRSRQHPDRRGPTPLIISGPAEESTDLYYEVNRIDSPPQAGGGHPR